MTESSDRMKKVPIVHKEDRSMELASALGMQLHEWVSAQRMRLLIIKHDLWTAQRSPHALVIDCLFIIGKHTGNKKVTQASILKTTKELWGLCTGPRPHTWRKDFLSIIQEVLDELDSHDTD